MHTNPIKRGLSNVMIGLASAMNVISLQLGLGNVQGAMEAARKLDQAYSGAALVPPEHEQTLEESSDPWAMYGRCSDGADAADATDAPFPSGEAADEQPASETGGAPAAETGDAAN